ncbi:MAG TPA: hypothetical protein VF532_17145 [Candidatus Angelobacter sp.]
MADILIQGDGKFPMDVQVPIVSANTTTDGRTVIITQGEHRGRSVGVELSVRGQMKPGIVGDDIDKTAFYGSGVIVRGMGDITRHLADLFSEVYIIPATNAEPLQQLDLTTIALDGDPMLIETEHLNFKVFHDAEDKVGLYFEMFLHIDIPSGYVRFDEKDEEYRVNVVRSFAALRPIVA